MNTVIIIGVIIVAILIARMFLSGAVGGFTNVDIVEFKKLAKQKNTVILDVRAPRELKAGKIKGAKNINFNGEQFQQQIEKLDKSKKYLVYCRSGMRSAHASSKMAKIGIEEVFNLKGGYMMWSRKS